MIFTVGHGARSAAELVRILQEAHVRTLVDVRAFPVSRRHPQFSADPLSSTLQDAGIAYEWQGKALGGYRKGPYQEHMKTGLFRDAAAALAHRADRACLMCAHGTKVVHLLGQGRSAEHAKNPQEELWRDD